MKTGDRFEVCAAWEIKTTPTTRILLVPGDVFVVVSVVFDFLAGPSVSDAAVVQVTKLESTGDLETDLERAGLLGSRLQIFAPPTHLPLKVKPL